MKIIVPRFDLRSHGSGSHSIDDEAGNLVGVLRFSAGTPLRRTVHLFGKYWGQFETHDECQAFADGVAAVLTHMITVDQEGLAKY